MEQPDAGNPDLLEPEPPDLAPAGTSLISGQVHLLPLTVGDWLFVADSANEKITALPPNGGAPVELGITWYVGEAHDSLVFFWDLPNHLHVFDVSGQLHDLSSGAADYARLSSDGQFVGFIDNSSLTQGDLVVVRTDGTGSKTLYSAQPTQYTSTQCSAFIGACGGSTFCLSHCEMGDTTRRLAVYDAATDTTTELGTGFGYVRLGDGALVANQGSQPMMLRTDGSPGFALPDFDFTGNSFFTPTTFFYQSPSNELKRVEVAGGTPVVLQTGLRLLLAQTADLLVYCTPTELYQTPLQPGPAVRTDDTFRDFGYVDYGAAPDFTVDGKANLYVDSTATLRLAPLDGSGARSLGTGVRGFRALDGGRVLVEDGSVNDGLNLKIVDENGTLQQPIVTGAELTVAAAHRAAWQMPNPAGKEVRAASY
jgi:hypothetical protein